MCVANNCFLMIISSASHYYIVMEEHSTHNLPLKVWQNLQFDAHLHFADSSVEMISNHLSLMLYAACSSAMLGLGQA